jgi:UDP-N-acetylmuramoyl-tripeptide--D-alanyl-D-alanine ligase
MADAIRAATDGALPDGVIGLSIDSRTIQPGEAYFAIKGDVHDGHDFVAAALKAGAALAVVERSQAMRRCSSSTTCSMPCAISPVPRARG